MKWCLSGWLVLITIINEVKIIVHAFDILGKHAQSSCGTTVLGGKFPQTAVMYNHFIKPGKPLLMKAVLSEIKYPAFIDWTDEYLTEKFGDEVVSIWTGEPPEPVRISLSQFIEEYHRFGYALYDDMPQKMKAETLIPPVLQCGGIQDSLNSPGLFFSSGGDKTLLHYNGVDYLTCILDGTHEFVLFDKVHKELIERDGWVADGGYSLVDVEDVHKKEFPGLYSAPWQKASVTKGDCLLVPYGWYQHISTHLGRTLAIVMKFSHLWLFDKADCDNRDRNETLKPLSEFDVLDEIGELRTSLLAPFSNISSVAKETFLQTVDCGSKQLTEQFWLYIDRNNDESLSWPELYNFDMNFDQHKFHKCYQNISRLQKVHKLIHSSSGERTYDSVKSEKVKTDPEEEKTIADIVDKLRKTGREWASGGGTGKVADDVKDSDSVVKVNKNRKESDKVNSKNDEHRHEEF